MRILIELDAAELVRWRGKAGHIGDDGKFVVDDLPGEATGPLGKVHGARGDGKTLCGKDIPASVETAPDQGAFCAQCLSRQDGYTLI